MTTQNTTGPTIGLTSQLARTPLMLLGDPVWHQLTEQNVNQMTATLRRQLTIACPKGVAREFAETLSVRTGASSVEDMETALRQFPLIVAEDIVYKLSNEGRTTTSQDIFVVGRDIYCRIEEAIARGRQLLQVSTNRTTPAPSPGDESSFTST